MRRRSGLGLLAACGCFALTLASMPEPVAAQPPAANAVAVPQLEEVYWSVIDVGENEIALWAYLPEGADPDDVLDDIAVQLGGWPNFEWVEFTDAPLVVAVEMADPPAKPSKDDLDKIGKGHAFKKHVQGEKNKNGKEFEKGKVIGGKAFPGPSITTEQEFQDFINKIVNDPNTIAKYDAATGKWYFWDDTTGTIVVYDPRNPDKGTCFRPDDGKKYFDRQPGVIQ